ncbi:OHCU decarboxylase [Nocardia sp. CDC159]|uniref:OHCU decarboxylase n=1 Tax=Nocardia pulmonis TaxID=2951408 RepID=A0A9X2IUE1_9NOCA|nr:MULTISPECIES: 2-oxo-4-hydroxy-4-carboxy-5-ureidoimidazoline decarboxylase [Nocardia]MCM6772777.1 OHCU decarboxylase [Nocardia pulmonis]MCM6785920.1 OHCU decarboxylase [Nocardia sp. CDC159]
MLMHQGLGLDRFNSLPRGRAVHALYECCCAVTWAEKIADGRPYPTREALFAAVDAELRALSPADLERVFDSFVHDHVSARTVPELARVMHDHIDRMLGPAEGYPEY